MNIVVGSLDIFFDIFNTFFQKFGHLLLMVLVVLRERQFCFIIISRGNKPYSNSSPHIRDRSLLTSTKKGGGGGSPKVDKLLELLRG